MAGEQKTTAVDIYISCAGTQIRDDLLQSFNVEMDLDQPDMCVVTVDNAEGFSNTVNLADDLEVKVGGSGGTRIFKGEVVGIEPIYKTGADTKVIIRAFNRLHRLLRGRNSRTYTDKKDSDIAKQIAGENGLTGGGVEATQVAHEHVYQHNQTDLEFLRILAARNGFEVFVEDKELTFRKPKPDKDSGIELRLNDDSAPYLLKQFTPRLSSAGIVSQVTVRAWDPEKKKEIIGEAKPEGSKLGSQLGTAAAEAAFGNEISFTVDRPVDTKEEADALAKARLRDLMMQYITGEAVCHSQDKQSLGNLKAGIVVTITVNVHENNDKFNGKYYLAGVSHRYKHSGSPGSGQQGGYSVACRVERDATEPK